MTPATIGVGRPAGVAMPVSAVPPERSVRAWVGQSLVLAGRQLAVLVRDRATILQLILVPVLTMIMFKVVLGETVGRATGQNSAYGTVPLVILVSAMFGALASGIRLNGERSTGLLARLEVLPINRAADLTSRVVCETVRILVTTSVLLVAGLTIGFRFTQGVLPVVGIFAVALLFGSAFAVLVLALAVNSPSGAPIMQLMSLVSSLLMFFNSGFSPVEAYPGWLRPIVANQPMTPAIDAMRHLAVGGPVAHDLWVVIAWAVGIVAVFTVPALRGYRRAATTR